MLLRLGYGVRMLWHTAQQSRALSMPGMGESDVSPPGQVVPTKMWSQSIRAQATVRRIRDTSRYSNLRTVLVRVGKDLRRNANKPPATYTHQNQRLLFNGAMFAPRRTDRRGDRMRISSSIG